MSRNFDGCNIEEFRLKLLKTIEENRFKFEDTRKNWVVKGFIDVEKNIYSISADTKVVSKIIELILFPILEKFAEDHNYSLEPAKCQNHYPDATFIDRGTGEKIAIDIKTTYRVNSNTVNGFTLGAYGGYFVDRSHSKNITFPYNDYSHHIVLGVIYSQEKELTEMITYNLSELENMPSVVNDFTFLVQEKYKIAGKLPGSGNTTNIGSIKDIEQLINGKGPFSKLGVDVFDKYWIDLYYKRSGKNDIRGQITF